MTTAAAATAYLTTILTHVQAYKDGLLDATWELHDHTNDGDATDHTHVLEVPIEIEHMMQHKELKGYDEVHLLYLGDPLKSPSAELVRTALFKRGDDGEAFEQDDTGLVG